MLFNFQKTLAVFILALAAICLAKEQQSEKEPASPTPSPAPITKKQEVKKQEGRGFARMEISDAQLEMALKDKRYLLRQLKCTLGEAPCDPVGRRLKSKYFHSDLAKRSGLTL